MTAAVADCLSITTSDTVRGVPRPATGKTFVARARVERGKWDRFEDAATAQGTDRSKVLNEFIDWYLRERGAALPERPPRKLPDPPQ